VFRVQDFLRRLIFNSLGNTKNISLEVSESLNSHRKISANFRTTHLQKNLAMFKLIKTAPLSDFINCRNLGKSENRKFGYEELSWVSV
jgi:hypothetical protein